ncbi:hypothetical protein ACWGNN_11325 [Streptomyces sp. NPDC055817]
MAAPTKTVAQKLLIKPGTTVWATPEEHLPLIGALPVDVDVADVLSTATTGLMFATDESALHRLLDEHRDGLSGPVNFWVVYPKGNKADINRDSLRRILAEYGMRPIAQIAVDDVGVAADPPLCVPPWPSTSPCPPVRSAQRKWRSGSRPPHPCGRPVARARQRRLVPGFLRLCQDGPHGRAKQASGAGVRPRGRAGGNAGARFRV